MVDNIRNMADGSIRNIRNTADGSIRNNMADGNIRNIRNMAKGVRNSSRNIELSERGQHQWRPRRPPMA